MKYVLALLLIVGCASVTGEEQTFVPAKGPGCECSVEAGCEVGTCDETTLVCRDGKMECETDDDCSCGAVCVERGPVERVCWHECVVDSQCPQGFTCLGYYCVYVSP